MTLQWQWNGDTHTALHEPFVLVVQDHETTFDYYVWDKEASGDGPAAFGTVYSLERAFEAAETALFNIRMAQAKGWELWRSYLQPRGLAAPADQSMHVHVLQNEREGHRGIPQGNPPDTWRPIMINMDAIYDEATRCAWEVLRAYDYSLGGLNLYMQLYEPRHFIFYTFQWRENEWTGEVQCWDNGQDAGHITTKETYPTHEEAMSAILREVKLTDAPYEN